MVGGGDDWCSVSEAARRLGITRASVRGRIKRGTLPTMTDNHGNPLVRLQTPPPGAAPPGAHLENPPGAAPGDATTPHHAPDAMPMSAHTQVLETLHAVHLEAMAALRADHAADRQRHEAELVRQEARHLAELTRLERAYQSAADALMAKVSAIMVASRPRRSWWRW